MSSRSYSSVSKEFASSVETAFAFLAGDFGFVGPERDDRVIQELSYSRDGLRCRVYLDHSEMSVLTHVELEDGDVCLVATLQQLVTALNRSSRVRASAHSLTSMESTLHDNAAFLRNVLPRLTAGGAMAVMKLAGAREWRRPSAR